MNHLGVLSRLPDEIVVKILWYLSIPEIDTFLLIGKTIRNQYLPYIQKERHDYYCYPKVAQKAVVEALGSFILPGPDFLLIPKHVAKIMDLTHFPAYNQKWHYYNYTLYQWWWSIYIRKHNLVKVIAVEHDDVTQNIFSTFSLNALYPHHIHDFHRQLLSVTAKTFNPPNNLECFAQQIFYERSQLEIYLKTSMGDMVIRQMNKPRL